jgi:chaperone modulatory protein CbpM
MIGFDAVIAEIGGLEEWELRRWIEERWVRPEAAGGAYMFHEVDIARVRLIVELRHELAIDEETMPVVLQLLDQVYALRRRLKAIRAVVDGQPGELRQTLLAQFGTFLAEDDAEN